MKYKCEECGWYSCSNVDKKCEPLDGKKHEPKWKEIKDA